MIFKRRNPARVQRADLTPDPEWHPRQVPGRDRKPDPENRMIDLESVRLAFGDKVVLDGVWLEVDRGETLVVMGASGAGKSTILRIILGLLAPDDGFVYVGGVNIVDARHEVLNQVRRGIGMVFQGGALFDSLTVSENLTFRLREEGMRDPAELDRHVQERLSFVNLEPEDADLMPSELSGGMKKRVALARAIMGSPNIVLYDEPTTGLDPITAETINALINKLRDQQSVASVVVTHDIGSALAVGNRFAMLKDGDIIFEGDADELRSCDDAYVRHFLDARLIEA